MPLGNYTDLENLDVASIRRLLDPNFDRSEVNRVAAERSLGGGGFSGARQNRLMESEINARALQGHSMLSPYLQREQQRNLQTQGEAAALQRQINQNNADTERDMRNRNHATAAQIRGIDADIAAREKDNVALFERLRFSEANTTSRAAMGEQGMNTRLATSLEGQLAQQREGALSSYGIAQGNWANQLEMQRRGATSDRELAQGNWDNNLAVAGARNSSSRGPANQSAGQPGNSGPTSATMAEIQSRIGGGNGKSPNLLGNQTPGSTMWGNTSTGQTGTGWGGNGLAQNSSYTSNLGSYQTGGGGGGQSTVGPYSGGYQFENQNPGNNFVDSADPYSYDWATGSDAPSAFGDVNDPWSWYED